MSSAPIINFNGVFLVNSLEDGLVLTGADPAPAVRILMRQILDYPILAVGERAVEIRAYYKCAQEKGIARLEAYAPCYLVRDLQSGRWVSLASTVTWYAPALDPSCVTQRQSIQQTRREPFAVFAEESYPSVGG